MKKKKARRVRKDPLRSLIARIGEDYRKIQDLYKNNDGRGLAAFLEQRAAVLVTPDYRRIRGQASAKIWTKAREQKVRLKFKPVNVFLGNAIGVKKLEGQTLDQVAFVVHEVHFIEKTKGARRNATGYLLTTSKHIDLCPWF